MTLDQFERIVLKLANQTAVRYWKHWNYPTQEPWVMALRVYPTNGFNPQDDELIADLAARGIEWDEVDRQFYADRTNEDGTPFRLDL